jgi:hypothetical protein
VAVPGLAAAELDFEGNVIGSSPATWDTPGDPCGQCASPDAIKGVDFKGNDLWGISSGGLLYHFVNCSVVENVQTQVPASTFGLGYDATRNLWVITSPASDRVYQVDLAGAVVNSWATPGTGPVGAAYDQSRDLYWMTDFSTNQLYSISPATGLPGPAFAAPAGTRLAGTGYNRGDDILFYHGRDQAMSYCMSAATGQLLYSFPVPFGGGNNGQGAGCDPVTGNGWLSHFEQPYLYCVESCGGATPVETTTWGVIKSLYD